MRFLADENFPLDAVDALRENGHDVVDRYFNTYGGLCCGLNWIGEAIDAKGTRDFYIS